MEGKYKYMVEFVLPIPIPMDLQAMIPAQRNVVHRLFMEGRLLSYTLTEDRSKLWAIFLADSESELISYIDRLPMTGYMQYDYQRLMFHETIKYLTTMSLN